MDLDPPSRKRPRTDGEAEPPSGFYGVRAHRKRWAADIYYDSKKHYLGIFGTKQEAALAYDRKARQCGKDKPLNYESIAAAEEAAKQAHTKNNLVHPQQPKPCPPSGFYGVSASRKRWTAHSYYDNNKHHLGTFDTKQEAALAYDRAARQCGDNKPLNYESIAAAEEAAVQAQAEHILVHDMCAGPKQPRPRPPSGFYGVSAVGKRWRAEICYDRKLHTLGKFDTKQEAALAYDREVRQCGEAKPLNYESIAAAEEAAAEAQAEHILIEMWASKARASGNILQADCHSDDGPTQTNAQIVCKLSKPSRIQTPGRDTRSQTLGRDQPTKKRKHKQDRIVRLELCRLNANHRIDPFADHIQGSTQTKGSGQIDRGSRRVDEEREKAKIEAEKKVDSEREQHMQDREKQGQQEQLKRQQQPMQQKDGGSDTVAHGSDGNTGKAEDGEKGASGKRRTARRRKKRVQRAFDPNNLLRSNAHKCRGSTAEGGHAEDTRTAMKVGSISSSVKSAGKRKRSVSTEKREIVDTTEEEGQGQGYDKDDNEDEDEDEDMEIEQWETSGHRWIGVRLARCFDGKVAIGCITRWLPASE
jgi:hypothetical protein